MARRRSVKSKKDYNPALAESLVWTMCSTPGCGIEEKIPGTCTLICSNCTQMKSIGLLSESDRKKLFGTIGRNKSGSRPRGWRWMSEFVDIEGNVFIKGVEKPKLKGTLPITDVAAIKARQKANKEKRRLADQKGLLKMAAEKKELKKAIDAQKDFLSHKAGKK